MIGLFFIVEHDHSLIRNFHYLNIIKIIQLQWIVFLAFIEIEGISLILSFIWIEFPPILLKKEQNEKSTHH
ncbi:hypothetical protein HPSNT_03240 [Helicobacter pylori SNT49]|uniref:Uncharacterized protein n=1 Tax=Helicobacter pylori SNT49 TaxID=1055530 RepID=G2MBT2_HELPX|nr:hypothetical protein HPSNT_03240 [Helicobacter pylori SNT49]